MSNTFGESDFSTYAPVRCFEVQTGKLLWQIKAPALGGKDSSNASVCHAIFSPDGRAVAAYQYQRGRVLLLDSATGAIKPTRQFRVASKTRLYVPPGLLFAPNGKRLFVRGDSAVLVWDLDQ